MNGEWCYFKNRFTKQQCETILEHALKIPAQDAKIGVSGELVVSDMRRSKIRFLHPNTNPNLDFLWEDIWRMGTQANNDWFNFHINRLSFIQLAEYDEKYQGEYKKHHDVFWMNDDPFYHRKLTCVIQLSDPSTYDGGDFEIYQTNNVPDKQEIRTQGTAIFIPSFIEHAALPVTKGTRYSIAVWFDGPKWR
jgi:PKHD-type hydroxylase